jgi:ankyrin repeat protein
MGKKYKKIVGKPVLLITGLVFGNVHFTLGSLGTEIPPSIPCFLQWTDRTSLDSRVAIGTNVTTIDKIKDLVTSYINNKNYNPNQKVMMGYYLPLIFYVASLSAADELKILLSNNDTVVAVETALGDTPMHAAAINSSECLKLLIADQRLNVNEHNNNGETPLYVAMKYHYVTPGGDGTTISYSQLNDNVKELLLADFIQVDSVDEAFGCNMLHIAVKQKNENVVKQILAIQTNRNYPLSDIVNAKDKALKTPADYLEDIQDNVLRHNIQNALSGIGAVFGVGCMLDGNTYGPEASVPTFG